MGGSTARSALAALLVASAALFAVGAAREHSTHHSEKSPSEVAVRPTSVGGESTESGVETAVSTSVEAPHSSEVTAEGRVLGVNLEAWAFVIAVVVASIAFAVLVVRFPRRSLLALIAIVTAVAAVFDVAEVVHQVHDSQQLLAAIAVAVAVLHVAGFALAALIIRPSSA